VEAAMGAEISGEDGNGDCALTVACQALQPSQGGRGECGVAVGEREAAMAWWSCTVLGGAALFHGERERGRWRVREGARVSGMDSAGS